jgi:alanyl-tRNA synthetase
MKKRVAEGRRSISEWKKYVPESRIILGNKKDNFWEMGDTGPCGPVLKFMWIAAGRRRKANLRGSLVNNDHPQVIEIWNNVFIQFNRKKDGALEPLPPGMLIREWDLSVL